MIHVFSLALLIMSSSLVAMDDSNGCVDLNDVDLSGMTVLFPKDHVRSREDVDLLLDEEGFMVKNGELVTRIQKHDTHPLFRDAHMKSIAQYGATNKFIVRNFDNGDYAVEPACELRGGGVFGATGGAIFGKFVVHFIGHGLIQVAAVCTGPAYGVTVVALEAALLPTVIEPLSNVVAIGTGVIGGVATGPV